MGTLAALLVAVIGFGGLIAKWATNDSLPVADAWRPSPPATSSPITLSPNETRSAPLTVPPVSYPTDDKGFVHSSARCRGSQRAFAIGRTTGSLIVICGGQAGRYTYLGVRLSDAAMLRTTASIDSARGFLARKAGVLYAVTRRELKVTAGGTVIKQEPMVEYREVAR